MQSGDARMHVNPGDDDFDGDFDGNADGNAERDGKPINESLIVVLLMMRRSIAAMYIFAELT